MIFSLGIYLLLGHIYGPTTVDTFKCSDDSSDRVLFFANGMNNSKFDAQEALTILKSKVTGKFVDFDIAYNHDELFILELYEAFRQRRSASEKFLWSYLSRYRGPEWYSRLVQEKLGSVTRKEFVNDADLRRHVAQYQGYFKKDLGLVIVSHSQGNFYANAAYEHLSEGGFLDEGDGRKSYRMSIVGVASPDSYVAGGGKYRTLFSDGVITPIPLSLPPNVENNPAGLFDHVFLDHYLNGKVSGEEILSLIDQLSSGDGFFPEAYVTDDLRAMNLWLSRWAQLTEKGHEDAKMISRTQCLAIQIFFYLGDWFGSDCSRRSLDHIRKYALSCFEREWSNPSQAEYDCNLSGLDYRMVGLSSPILESRYLSSIEACRWKGEAVHQLMSRTQVEEALAFIASQHSE